MKVKEESEKVSIKCNIQKTKIMVFGSITSWHIDGELVETVVEFIFWGSETTADGDCSHDSKRHLPRGREAWTNLESMLKSRDIIALSSQSCAFSSSHVRMSGLDCQESWAAEN